jgi:hypothetical protein
MNELEELEKACKADGYKEFEHVEGIEPRADQLSELMKIAQQKDLFYAFWLAFNAGVNAGRKAKK